MPETKPKLVYFKIAGRGELTRLTAAAGGVEIDETMPENWREYCTERGFPEALPLLEHGDFKLNQSGAIVRYVAALAPKFASLTPQQRAVDDMFACTLEDMIAAVGGLIFGAPDDAPAKLPGIVDKFFGFLEKQLPADGAFVNGEAFPTISDLVAFNVVKAYMPFGAAFKLAKDKKPDLPKAFPKLVALADKVAAAPGVKEYLATTGGKSVTGAVGNF